MTDAPKVDHAAAHKWALKGSSFAPDANLRRAYLELEAKHERLGELANDASDLLDDARSGYIGGCGEDLKWDARREEFRSALRDELKGE